jgi:2-oxo-4-hydroxy-4-carboxy-5-ureidoimidazoline decarboxylase
MTAAGLAAFNALPDDEARTRLAACLDVRRWVDEVLAGRPYATDEELTAVATASADAMTGAELEAALARHPRIGERPGAGHDAAHSTREQAGVAGSDAATAQRLAEGNRAYEERFGRVFLIRAAGRTAEEILAELERRLGSSDATERAETIHQLREIAVLRLQELVR